MKAKVTTKTVSKKKDIPEKILKQLWKLNFSSGSHYFGSGSALLNMLQDLSQEKDKLKIAYVEDKKGKVLSWGAISSYEKDIHIYTRKDYRRKGFGTKVYRALMRGFKEKNVSISPHDEASTKFYSTVRKKLSYGCQCSSCTGSNY